MARNIFCEFCGKSPSVGNNRPKSLHKTKKVIYPNIQKWNGFHICNSCRRTIKKFTPKPVEKTAKVA